MHGKLANVTIKDYLNCEIGYQIGTNEMFTPIGFEAIAALNEDKLILFAAEPMKSKVKNQGTYESKLNNKTVTVTIGRLLTKSFGNCKRYIIVKKYEANVVCGN